MKKIMTTFCLILVVTFTIQAQFQIGPKVGMNLANCAFNLDDSDFEPETKIRLAYAVGFALDYGFNDAFSLQSGLMFTSKGYSYDLDEISDDDITYDGYDRTILNYFELPVSAVYKFKGFQIGAGPYIAYGISGKEKWDYTYDYYGTEEGDSGETKLKPKMGEVEDGDLDEDEEAFYAMDWGFNFGIGYQTGGLLVNAGYSLGLGNIMAKYSGFEREDYKFSNRVITVSGTYLFNLGD